MVNHNEHQGRASTLQVRNTSTEAGTWSKLFRDFRLENYVIFVTFQLTKINCTVKISTDVLASIFHTSQVRENGKIQGRIAGEMNNKIPASGFLVLSYERTSSKLNTLRSHTTKYMENRPFKKI